MQSHVIKVDTTGMTHTFYEIEKRKKTQENRTQRRQKSKEKKKKKYKEERDVVPPRRGCSRHLKKTSWEKKEKKKTWLLVNSVGLQITRENTRQTREEQSTLQVAAAVFVVRVA